MRGILAGLVLSFILLISSASAQVAEIPNFGSYPKYGDGFLYLAEGGYAELPDSNVNDIDYSTTSFSVEAIVDVRSYLSYGGYPAIISKMEERIYQESSAGWGLSVNSPALEQIRYSIGAKVGDGTQHVYLTKTVNGAVHAVMTWDYSTKTLELFVDGESAGSASNSNISLSDIDTSRPLEIGKNYGELKRNVLMVRWWGRKLSDQDVTALAGNWANNGDDRVPPGVSTSDLVSEWLMDGECAQDGSPGTGYLKDSAGNHHLQMTGNASLKVSAGELLTLVSPADGSTNIHKSVTLKASGGDADITNPEHPLSYFFQVDTTNTFGSSNLKESGWIPGYSEWMPVLDVGTEYYWRVKVRDSDGIESAYSETRSFTTEPATTWYVRPEDGDYGSEDGTSFENAWDGLHAIVFGEQGVEPGDTLYVCGVHVFNRTQYSYFVAQDDVFVKSGASEDSPYWVKIRGDCSGDQGIVWGAYKRSFGDPWVDEGDGIWSTTIYGSSPANWYFQDIGVPEHDSYVILEAVSSLEELRAHPGGAQYSDNYGGGGPIYVKLTDGGDPTDRFYFAEFGYEFQVAQTEYIEFSNIKFYVPRFNWGIGEAAHLRWNNCTLWYGFFNFRDGTHHIEFIGCDRAYGMGGFGFQDAYAPYVVDAPHHITISGCKIHDMGIYNPNPDAHGIGVNGANYMTIEKNEFYNVGSAVTFYPYDPQTAVNNTIRWNWVHDTHTLGGANSRGIELNFGALANDTRGNRVYGNIVGPGVDDVGYRSKYRDEVQFYNNLCYRCGDSFVFLNHLEPVRVKLRNLISIEPTRNHIYFGSHGNESEYSIDSDYNLFWPVSGDQFYFRSYLSGDIYNVNFSEWQSLSKSGSTFDPHSITENPLLMNPSINDFRLQAGSPAIDSGTDVGLTIDFDGNPITGIPDIGAFEYSDCGPVEGDLNGDCSVTILDLAMIALDFGRTFGFDPRADTDGSSEIDVYDLVFVASRFTG